MFREAWIEYPHQTYREPPRFTPLLPGSARNPQRQLRVRVEVAGLQDTHLVGPSVPSTSRPTSRPSSTRTRARRTSRRAFRELVVQRDQLLAAAVARTSAALAPDLRPLPRALSRSAVALADVAAAGVRRAGPRRANERVLPAGAPLAGLPSALRRRAPGRRRRRARISRPFGWRTGSGPAADSRTTRRRPHRTSCRRSCTS